MARLIDPRFVRTRQSRTLKRWWRELNRFGWPNELGLPDDAQRDAVMQQLAAELGYRWICGKLKAKETK